METEQVEIQQVNRKFNRESLERLERMSFDFYSLIDSQLDVDRLHVMIDMVGQFRFILDSLVDIPEKPVVIAEPVVIEDRKSWLEHFGQLLYLSSEFHRSAWHEYERFLGFHPIDVDNLHVMADMIDQLRSVLDSLVCRDIRKCLEGGKHDDE